MQIGGDGSERYSGQMLLKNSSLNFFGQALPILIALFSIPNLIHRLGDERFGVLMLAWMFLGYFNLFDFGLSRALTKSIAERLDTDREGEIGTMFWTVCVATAIFGILGATVMALSSKWLVTNGLKVPPSLETETLQAFYVIAFALPFVITTSCFRGVLEATQNFRAINRIQVPVGSLFYLSPLIFAIYSTYLPFVISALVIARIIGWFFYLRRGIQSLPGASKISTDYSVLPSLMKFGGWVTIANIPMPLIGYADRFVIGVLMSLAAVTYYSTPYEIINKVTVIPAAVLSVIFPTFAAQLTADRARASLTFARANKLIFIAILPISVVALLFSHETLSLWAGVTLADQSFRVLQILSLALFFNCFGIVPSALLDALGKPAITAVSHLIQLPVYVGALFYFIPRYGLEAAAIIWVVRNAVDTGILYTFAAREFPQARLKLTHVFFATVPLTVLTVVTALFRIPLESRVSLFLILAGLFVPSVWLFVLSRSDRGWVSKAVFSAFNSKKLEIGSPGPRQKVGIALAAYKPKLHVFTVQLQTIQSQTFSNWICVVSMDSDLDLQDQALKSFMSDPRFIWVRNPGRRGVKANFENAVNVAIDHGAEMIAFADQDDVWYPNKLLRLVETLRLCPPMSLVHSDMHVFTEDSDLQSAEFLTRAWVGESRVLENYSPLHFMLRNTVTGASSLFDVSLAKKISPIPISIDYHDHWVAILASVFGEIRPVHEPLYAYRQHQDNVIGFIAFKGIFYKPEDVSWFEGWKKAGIGWSKRKHLFETIMKMDDAAERLPSSYNYIFKHNLPGPFVFLLAWLLYIKDDPSLARTFLNNGMGGFTNPVLDDESLA